MRYVIYLVIAGIIIGIQSADSVYAFICEYKSKTRDFFSLSLYVTIFCLSFVAHGLSFYWFYINNSLWDMLFALFMSVGMCAMMISFNHNDVIDSYKRELKYNKYFVKQKTIKL